MATIKDVSRLTGLSISTISKYINGGNVRGENKTRIDEAIRSLNFKVNPAARALKTNRSMTVGVLLPSLDVSFFAGIVADIEARLFEAGYNTIVCSCNHSAELERRKLEFFIEQQVDGIILVCEWMKAEELLAYPEIARGEIPLVLLDRYVENFPGDFVLVDSASVCRFAVGQFLLNGHKKIGLITGPGTISTARERLEGYQQALVAHGIEPKPAWVKVGDYSLNSGYRLFNELIDSADAPTAILVTNYEMTMGAITAAHERKMKIPRDISFIGYDNLQLAQILNPPVTIVLQPTDKMAEETASLLLRRMRGDKSDAPHTVMLKACLMLQESIQPPSA